VLSSAKSIIINSDIDFLSLSKKEKKPRVRIRLLGLAHIKDGASYRKTAKMLKVSLVSVQNWANRFKKSGLKGLNDQEGSGCKPLFPQEKEEELKRLILEKQSKKSGGRLTGTDIKKIVNDDFGVKCALRTVYDLLHKIGLVWISSRSKHPKNDKKAQEDFKKNFKKKSNRSFTSRC